MARRTLEGLGAFVKAKRGSRRLRETAGEIGISPATLMRIENGRTPDIATFTKVCRWLQVDPNELMGFTVEQAKHHDEQARRPAKIHVSAHLRSDRAPKQETLQALVSMISLVAETQPQPDQDLRDGDI
ncbi:MAG: helix-turn-helix domain-containing protein [Nitrospirota bacterium]